MEPIKFNLLINGLVKVYGAAGNKGDYINIKLSNDIDYSKLAQILVYKEGSVDVERTEGDIPLKRLQRTAGECTLDIDPEIPTLWKGMLKLTVSSDTAKWYCLSNPDFKHLHAKSIRLSAGESLVINPGEFYFIGLGNIESRGIVYNDPYISLPLAEPDTITAKTDSLILRMVDDSVQA